MGNYISNEELSMVCTVVDVGQSGQPETNKQEVYLLSFINQTTVTSFVLN